MVRTLHGGPGLWGSAYNLPHAVYVFESHEMVAREILDLVPLEMVEREPGRPANRAATPGLLLTLTILVVLLVIVLGRLPRPPPGLTGTTIIPWCWPQPTF